MSGVWFSCGSTNGHQKDMSLKVSGVRAQILFILLGSIVNIIGEGTYMTI